MTLEFFINHYILNSDKTMWLLGAGASRSAGMPSATDIIWDLKRTYYCLQEDQSVTDNELSNEAVRAKIQNYLEMNGCPKMWAEDEYSYYFKLLFADDAALQQKYLSNMLHPTKISINSGHKIMSALIALQKIKIIFTTNFDSVLENAYSNVVGKELQAYNLEGSASVLDALNNETYPLYAKMHGDFRYREMKNLPESLLNNDESIQKAFVNACSRYGMIVCGYSGRDINVMKAFDLAIENDNAFPKGLFWITSIQGHVFPAVMELMVKAKAKGIQAEIIQADTFDSLMLRIWKMMAIPKSEFDQKIRNFEVKQPNIGKYDGTGAFPLIRTNAFPITKLKLVCWKLNTTRPITPTDLKIRFANQNSSAIIAAERNLLAWGEKEEILKIIKEEEILSWETMDLASQIDEFKENTVMNAFITKAFVRALVRDKPVRQRQRYGSYYVAISSRDEKFVAYEKLFKDALSAWDFKQSKAIPAQSLAGKVPDTVNTYWMEAAEISLEYMDGKFWLLVNPDVWIEPRENRNQSIDFLDKKKGKRYNPIQDKLLNAWKFLFFGSASSTSITPFANHTENQPVFEIDTTTAYAYKF